MPSLLSRLRDFFYPPAERIAVIIPVYNVTAYLEETLASVTSQNYPHIEIIVVDDGSEDFAAQEICRICAGFGKFVTLLHQSHGGAAAARDAGVRHTTAELIFFLDADDVLQPGALLYLARAARRHPAAVAVYARLLQTDASGKPLKDPKTIKFMPSGRNVLYDTLERKTPFTNGAICIRRAELVKLSPRNHGLRFGEDWMLWCHLALSGDIVPAGRRIVLHYRRHDDNASTAFLDDPSPLFAVFDRVFSDPDFIAAIGEDRLQHIKARLLSRIHMELAMAYLRDNKAERAQYHLSNVSVPVSSLFSNTR